MSRLRALALAPILAACSSSPEPAVPQPCPPPPAAAAAEPAPAPATTVAATTPAATATAAPASGPSGGVPVRDAKGAEAAAIRVEPDAITWKDAPPNLPPGAKVAVLEGDPKVAGPFTMRLKIPPKYRIPAHTHGGDERVAVLSGSVYVGFGQKIETADKTKSKKLKAGSFYVNPTPAPHFVFTENEEAVIQVTGWGPWTLEYVELPAIAAPPPGATAPPPGPQAPTTADKLKR